MAYDFPNSPTVGQKVTMPDTSVRVWDGTKWKASVGGATSGNWSARLQAQWVSGAIVQNDTIYFVYDAPYAGSISSLKYFTGVGSFTVNVQINGVSVGGLSAVSVSSATPATANATSANTFSIGQRITGVITGATLSPTDALLSLSVTWVT